MSILSSIDDVLRYGNELIFEVLGKDEKDIYMRIVVTPEDDFMVSTLSVPSRSRSRVFENVKDALSYWAANLAVESGLPIYSPVLREMQKSLLQWLTEGKEDES
jgi:DNA-binding protein Fis